LVPMPIEDMPLSILRLPLNSKSGCRYIIQS
jgi:hypothetical protein